MATTNQKGFLIVAGFIVTLLSSGLSSFVTLQLHSYDADDNMMGSLIVCQTKLEAHLEWHQSFKIPPEWFEEDVYDHIRDKELHPR